MATASTYVRELYALTEAVKKWRQYLLGNTFKIYIDHKSLMTQTIQTPEQKKGLPIYWGTTMRYITHLARKILLLVPNHHSTPACLSFSFLSVAVIS